MGLNSGKMGFDNIGFWQYVVVAKGIFLNMGLLQYGFWHYGVVAIMVFAILGCGNIVGFSNRGLMNY